MDQPKKEKSTSRFYWFDAPKKASKNKKSLLIYSEKEGDKVEKGNAEITSETPEKQAIQITTEANTFKSSQVQLNNYDMNQYFINQTALKHNLSTTPGPHTKSEKDFLNYLNFFQQNFKNSDLIELLDLSKHKTDTPFFSYTYPSSTLKKQPLYLYNNSNFNSTLVIDEEKKKANSSYVSSNSTHHATAQKKVCCGIYQVSNQILIDYDDNTTYEISSKSATNEKCSNDSMTQLNKLKEPLQRFEEIYYEDSKNFKPAFTSASSSSSVLINFNSNNGNNKLDEKKLKNLSFGSFV